jgi:hypothetical protein
VFCVIAGDPSSGFEVYGPFESRRTAVAWAWGNVRDWWEVEVRAPLGRDEETVEQLIASASREGQPEEETPVICADGPPGQDGDVYVEKTDTTLTGRAAASWAQAELRRALPLRVVRTLWMEEVQGLRSSEQQPLWIACDETIRARKFWKLGVWKR